MKKRQLIGGSRFVSSAIPTGFGMTFSMDDQGIVSGTLSFDVSKQGPPGHAHGGAIATILDEAMGAAAWFSGHRVLAVNLNVNYKKAVPLNTIIRVEGRVNHLEGRKIFAEARLILPDGQVAAESTGIFVDAPHVVGEEHPNPFDWK